MTYLPLVMPGVIALIVLKWAVQLWLEYVNRKQVLAHAHQIPAALQGTIDPAAYAKSVAYTLEQNRLQRFDLSYGAVVLLAVLLSGFLPWAYDWFMNSAGGSAWALAGFLFAIGVLLSLPDLPVEWYAQFKIEERFGFNTTTPRLWWADRIKSFLLTFILGVPLLTLILKLVEWMGAAWWIWAWIALVGFQLLMIVLAPAVILPLFNKFTPLPQGPLRDRLLRLGERTGFQSRGIQVMDGSKRSRHSNAFFTGFGRFRRIVLFDTLLQHLSENELEAVLAHEIGHYKKGHIPKMLLWSSASAFLGLLLIAWLAHQAWFYRAFGFQAEPGQIAPALLLFSLLSGVITFWIRPAANFWSRRHEYQADAYAADTMGEPESLIRALRKLHEKNLGNLTPHPIYSGFYYSHPTLLEREASLKARAQIHGGGERRPKALD